MLTPVQQHEQMLERYRDSAGLCASEQETGEDIRPDDFDSALPDPDVRLVLGRLRRLRPTVWQPSRSD